MDKDQRIKELEDWIRRDGFIHHTCTYEILNKEICSDCGCDRKVNNETNED